MRKRIFTLAIIILFLTLSAIIIFWGRGRYDRDLYFVCLPSFLGFPLFAVSSFGALVSSIMGKRKIRSIFLKCMGASLVIISLLIPVFIAYYVADYDVSVAKSFCEHLVPELEKIKSIEGQYPDTIDELISDRKIPDILEDNAFYYSDGTYFRFTIPDYSTLMGGWDYSNSNPTWKYWD